MKTFVRPEIGSGGDGHTFPGAAYPFGLVQPSPDTGREGYRYCAGYRYEDDRILGFSQTHLSGTGCGDLGDVRIMPFVGEPSPNVSSAFRKETQFCTPGYYAVTLDDCGQMSAWYLFSAMGFYPMNPASGEYVLGAPQLPKVVMRVTRGERSETTFTVIAKNLSSANKYVKSVTLNGVPLEGFTIRHEDILKGGELVFEMTD